MTPQQADAHQRKHGFPGVLEKFAQKGQAAQAAVDKLTGVNLSGKKPKQLRGTEPPKMNGTEAEFEVLLKAQVAEGAIDDYRFQGTRLRWGGGMYYKSDFTTRRSDGVITVIEVKGPQIWDRDIVRFKGCRAEWKEWFIFEMWQRDANKTWSRLL